MAAPGVTFSFVETSPSMCCCADWIGPLARDHAGRLAAVARREGASAVDALDLVQDAFHTLLERPEAHTLRDRPEEAARLLSVIVRNAARNARRRHHRAKPHEDVEIAVEAAVADPIEQERLGRCMAKLGEVHRHVITLRVLEELSGDEAANELGVTTNHVNVLLHRARKQLADCMSR
jgi:RNA polymerase sigma-70 factor (ECF subfamily)